MRIVDGKLDLDSPELKAAALGLAMGFRCGAKRQCDIAELAGMLHGTTEPTPAPWSEKAMEQFERMYFKALQLRELMRTGETDGRLYMDAIAGKIRGPQQ